MEKIQPVDDVKVFACPKNTSNTNKKIRPAVDVKVFARPTNTTNTNTKNTTCCRSEGVWPPNKYLHVSLPAFHKDKSLPNPIHCNDFDDAHSHCH